MSEKVLCVTNLSKQYGDMTAVDAISFEVHAREIVGLLGPNGAGKTTTINMILSILEPSMGTIHVEGMDITKQRSAALARTNFAAVYAPLPGNLTVYQNLKVFSLLYGVQDQGHGLEALIDRFDLKPFRNIKCGLLSSGEQTRVGLAKAMLNQPHLLLLDEPTASLDPAVARDIRLKIREFVTQTSAGVLWTSHNMYEVEAICDRVLFLSHGKILLEGDPKILPREYGKKTLEELFITIAREPLSLENT